MGIYTARGSRTCLGRPGSDGHEVQDAALWASWGIDYLKEDSCGGHTSGTVWQQYARMRDALNATGRHIYYSITQGVPYNDGPGRSPMHCYGESAFTIKPWVAEGKDPTQLANSFLVEYCNNLDFFGYTGGIPRPGGAISQIDSQALLTFNNLTKSGAYNDMDMLTGKSSLVRAKHRRRRIAADAKCAHRLRHSLQRWSVGRRVSESIFYFRHPEQPAHSGQRCSQSQRRMRGYHPQSRGNRSATGRPRRSRHARPPMARCALATGSCSAAGRTRCRPDHAGHGSVRAVCFCFCFVSLALAESQHPPHAVTERQRPLPDLRGLSRSEPRAG